MKTSTLTLCMFGHALHAWTGFSALHEDLDSPRSIRCSDTAGGRPAQGQQVPVVSAEELSISLSSLHETSEHLKNAQKEKLQKDMETTQ